MQRILLVASLAAVVVGGSLGIGPNYVENGTWEEVCSGQSSSTVNSTITIAPLPGSGGRFTPSCLAVDNGQKITWDNQNLGAHDPGDGREDTREFAECFRAAIFIDEGNLASGDTFSIQLYFYEGNDTLVLQKAWHNGDREDLDDGDPGFTTIECDDVSWERLDSDTIGIHYIDYIYPDRMSGQILLNL